MNLPIPSQLCLLFLLGQLERPLVAATDPPFRISISVSPFTELLFKSGVTFTDGNVTARTPEELQRLFMAYGANEVYARIATARSQTRGFGDHSLARGLERARMARALHLDFNPELGLFGDYGDIRCQPSPDLAGYPKIKAPATWTELSLDEMLPLLRSYAASVARAILQTGAHVRIWDLGNEVEFGMAGVAPRPMPGGCDDSSGADWYRAPDRVDPAIGKMSIVELLRMDDVQRIAWLRAHIWPHQARMFAALAAGIRSADRKARFSTHVSGNFAVLPADAVAFYTAMRDGGFTPDELGFSFYPTASSRPPRRLEAFRETIAAVRKELHRPVFVAEFGYPAERMTVGAFANWNNAVDGFPLTAAGQADFYRDFAAWAVGHGVSGVRPWAPEAVVPGWDPFALFAASGKTAMARPALKALADGAASRKP